MFVLGCGSLLNTLCPPLPPPPHTHTTQVSTTRLAVRNIPPSWDEKRLKAAFIAGVKERATKENPKVVQVRMLAASWQTAYAAWPLCTSGSLAFVCV
jgi:hypothetical protein